MPKPSAVEALRTVADVAGVSPTLWRARADDLKLPWVEQTVSIVRWHLDDERASQLVVDALRHVGEHDPTAPVAQCSGPLATDDLWSELWRRFYAAAPRLFSPEAHELGDDARGVAYAFAYVRGSRPAQLEPGLASSPTLADLVEAIVDKRFMTLAALGLVDERAVFWRVNKGCVLHTYLAGHDSHEDCKWQGISLFNEPALREQVFILDLGDLGDELDTFDLDLLIHLGTHEQVHHALTATLRPGQQAFLGRLSMVTNELAVEMLTYAARWQLMDGGLPPTDIEAFDESVSQVFYMPALMALLSRTGPGVFDDLHGVIALADAGLDGDDERVAEMLTALTGDTRTVDEWLAFFGDDEAQREVVWPGGAISRSHGTSIHCENAPAVVLPDGACSWRWEHKHHREGGPAVVFADGRLEWWRHGKLHREDGPAVICADGQLEWIVNHQLHREDGPAVVHPDGHCEWWYSGVHLYESEDGPIARD